MTSKNMQQVDVGMEAISMHHFQVGQPMKADSHVGEGDMLLAGEARPRRPSGASGWRVEVVKLHSLGLSCCTRNGSVLASL